MKSRISFILLYCLPTLINAQQWTNPDTSVKLTFSVSSISVTTTPMDSIIPIPESKHDFSNFNFDFVEMNDTIISSVISKNNTYGETVELIYYPDSIPPKDWFKPDYITIQAQSINQKAATRIVQSNPWADNIQVSDYRILSIKNSSTLVQHYSGYFERNKAIGEQYFLIRKICVITEAKDESGIWHELKSDTVVRHFTDFSIGLKTTTSMIVKKPTGDFETELRFKMLITGPPGYGYQQNVYSNVFKGKIDRALLQ